MTQPTAPSPAERLRSDLRSFEDLPSPPQVLNDVWRALESPRSSAQMLSQAVERDPALTAKMLRLANSAYFGLMSPVADVPAACVVLGFETVRALAIGVSALDRLTGSVGTALDVTAFWKHSVGTAMAAQALTKHLRLPGPGTAFCAGVLHDVGQLVLATFSADRYARVAGVDGDLWEREVSEFGAASDEVGAWLGEDWHFPAEIREAIAGRREPWSAEGTWGALLHVADWIAAEHGCPSVPEQAPVGAPDGRALERIGLDEPGLTSVCSAFAANLENVEAFVDLARG